jgi:hypothetical protein
VCVIACATAAFCDPNVAPHAPQPYEATSVALARIALAFGFFAAVLAVLPFFAGAFAGFAGSSAFGLLARGAGSVPWIDQNLQPCRT